MKIRDSFKTRFLQTRTGARQLVVPILLGCSVLVTGCQQKNSQQDSASVVTTQSKSEPSIVDAKPDESAFTLEEGFALLNFDQFEAFGAAPQTWKSDGDEIVCAGKPRGYLYSKDSYANFTLRLDYRFQRPKKADDERKLNTGFLVYISGEHKLWPACLEVQGKQIQMAAIKENGGAEPITASDDEPAREKARKPVGQWNSVEIVSKDGGLSVTLNGTPISSSEPGSLKSGLIGIQAEDWPFSVRRLRIRAE